MDAHQVEQGISTAQVVVTFVSGLGLWEGAKGFWAYFRKRRQDRLDAEAKKLKAAEDTGVAKVEQSRDARKDAIAEVWRIAEERQQEIDRLNARDEEHRKSCHDRLDKAWAEIGVLQKANAKLEGRVAECERRWKDVSDLQGRMTKVEHDHDKG